MVTKVQVETLDNTLYVSESEQYVGKTLKRYYPVEM
jgi:hypothetical protein